MRNPPLSVAMAVSNGMPHVEASVRSILGQSFGDFEFVIGDDGSSDGTSGMLRSLAAEDGRIRLLRRETRSGLAGSANWVVREARAPLVARMDADDCSYPERLEREIALFDNRPDVQLVGTLSDGIDHKGQRVRAPDYWRLTRHSAFAPFPHSSIMFRRTAFERAGGYRAEAEYWEDLDLYLRIADFGRILVIPEALASVRYTAMSVRLTDNADRVDEAVDLMYRSLADYLRGGDYPHSFPGGGAVGPHAKLEPETFIGRGSVQLWSGKSPRLLKRMVRRGAFRPDLFSLWVVVWTLWSTISPGSMRFALSAAMRLRSMRPAALLRGCEFIEWDPRRARRGQPEAELGGAGRVVERRSDAAAAR